MVGKLVCQVRSALRRRAPAGPARRRTLRLILMATPLLAVCGSSALAGSAKLDALVKNLDAQAAQGDADPRAAYDALVKAGMSEEDAAAKIDSLRDTATQVQNARRDKEKADADKKKADEEAKKKADQNASGEGDWNFGQVFRDHDYKVTYPLTNACKLPQVVTIKYPTAFPLIGPTSVTVPAKSTIDVQMELKNSTLPPIPSPPWPIGVTFSCYDIKDDIVLTHPEARRSFSTPSGKGEWICNAMQRTHHIKMHVHIHGPPDPPPEGGGGGGKKKKPRPACSVYWNYREFYPSPGLRSPDQCNDDVRQEAHDYFGGADLAALRAKDPQAWSWAPSPDAIDKMSAPELLALRGKADAQARGGT
jgi:hypothetical protein